MASLHSLLVECPTISVCCWCDADFCGEAAQECSLCAHGRGLPRLGESFRCACQSGQGRVVGRIGEGCPVCSYSLGDPVAALLPFGSGDDPVVVVTPDAGQLDFIDPDAFRGGGVGISVEIGDALNEVAGDGVQESINDELIKKRASDR
jgi:hypothetical protein